MSNQSQNITIPVLLTLLRGGEPWSVMAAKSGFHSGTSLREHCIRRGLRRSMHGRQVIVIVEPT